MSPRKKSLPQSVTSAHVVSLPQHQDIALLAYEYFMQRGSTHGLDLDDWLQAERELLARDSTQLPPAPKPVRRRKAASTAAQ